MCISFHSGKSTIVQVIKQGKFVETMPTIGVDFETVMVGSATMRAWDVGGRGAGRPLSQMYYRNAKAFVYVVDSNDRNRTNTVREELDRLISEGALKDRFLLIFANKQDLPDAMSLEELREKLALNEFDEKIVWHLQAASAMENTGIKEGFEWLVNCFATKTDLMKPITETLHDSKVMKNDLLSVFKLNNWKKLWDKFVNF